jgi:general L-amino acid transport system permease protein
MVTQPSFPVRSSTAIPLWRDVRVYRIAAQVAFLIFVLAIVYFLYSNLNRGLSKFTNFSFDFLNATASLPLSESSIPYEAHDPMYRAYVVGVLNTLRVVVVGIALASVVGLFAGVARLSTNWLVAKIAHVYVEIFVDTPLLVQLYFWYLAGVLQLPRVQQSIQLFGDVYLSNRGLVMPWYDPNANFSSWLWVVAASLVLSVMAYVLLGRVREGTRPREWRWLWSLLLFVIIAVVSELVMDPLNVSVPNLQGFNFQGGISLSPQYVSLTLGLVLYTGAFIAEIVRAGIQAVSRGLNEASRALGLDYFQTLRLVTIPVALRVIIPPLTNQYLNLAKNSSLAIAVAYPDLFFVGGGIFNQTGQTIQVMAMMMATYLLMSLLISVLMNSVNAKFKLVER